MKIRTTFFFLLFLLISTIGFSQKYGNAFLEIGVGARAHGLAGAMSAQAKDVSAAFWNPAGLNGIESPLQFSAMHAEWFAGVAQYDYLAAAKRLDDKNTVAISFIRLGVDKIPNTLRLIEPDGTINYDNITEFSAADYALFFSLGRKWAKNPAWSYGGSFKVIRRVIGSFGGAWGFGLDAGIQYKKASFFAGLMAKDLTGTFNAWSFSLTDEEKDIFVQTGNEIPKSSIQTTNPSLIFAAGYQRSLGKNWDLMTELDFAVSTDGQRNVLISSKALNIDPRIGIEAGYKRIAYLRLGAGKFQRIKDDLDPEKKYLIFQPNIGLGLKLNRFHLDYSFDNLNQKGNPFYAHIFSLTLDFRPRGEQ